MQVADWLNGLGLGHYVEAFARQNVDPEVLANLTADDLETLGVAAVGDRRRLLCAIARLPALERPDPQPSERRVVTILYVDLSGYTALSNALDPEDLRQLQRHYWAVMGGIVEDNGGMVKERHGDGVIAIFGYPVTHGNDTLRAASTALEMHAAIADISGELRASLGLASELRVHIGIASGDVLATPPGADGDEYEIVGRDVALAARLNDLAQAGETIVTESVHQALGAYARTRPLGRAEIEGFPAPVPTHLLVGLDFSEPRLSPGEFVDRERELALACDVLDACARERRSHILHVRGRAGVGKTRFLQVLARTARKQGFVEHKIAILDFGARRHRSPMDALAHRLLGIPLGAGRAVRRDAAEKVFVEGSVDAALRVFLNDMLELPQPAQLSLTFDAMDVEMRRRARIDLLSALVHRQSASQPLLLAFEDVQWADAETLDALAALAAATRDCRLVLILSARIENDDPLGAGGRWTRRGVRSEVHAIELGPLGRAASRRLARSLAGSLSPWVMREVDRAEGNPLFLEQLIRHYQETRSGHVPVSIKELVQERMDRLPDGDRAALRAASVFGQRFRLEALRYLAQLPDYACVELVRRVFVRKDGEDLLFVHDLVRDAVYDTLARSHRRALHRRAAEWFDSRDPELYAQHLELAGAPEAARAYLLAAEEAARGHHYERALDLVEQGLRLAETARDTDDLLVLDGEILRTLGRHEESLQAFTDVLVRAGDAQARCHALVEIAVNQDLLERFPEALASLREAERIAAEGAFLELRSDIHFKRGEIYYTLCDIEDCLQQQQLALECAVRANSAEARSRALRGLGFAYFQRGYAMTAHRYFQESVAFSRAQGFERTAIETLHMTGYGPYYRLDLREALGIGKEAVANGRRTGHKRVVMNGGRLVGYVLEEMGRLEEAERIFEDNLRLARQLEARRFEAIVLRSLARIEALRGGADAAMALAEQAYAVSRAVDVRYMGPAVLGTLALVAGDVETQDRALREGRRILAEGSASHNHFWFHRDAIAVMLGRGDWEGARFHAAEMEAYASGEPLPWSDFHVEKARLLAALGERPQDAALLAAVEALRERAQTAGLATEIALIDNALWDADLGAREAG